MRIKAVSRGHRRGLHGCAALASAATLTAMTAALATGSPPAQAALSHHPGATTPDVTSQNPFLSGVSTVSATDAWAAGHYDNSSAVQVPLILHWNGTAWKAAKTPVPTGAKSSALTGVSADSATDAWASGYYVNSSGGEVPLIMHWTGTAWKRAKTPAPTGALASFLNGVSAVSATDAWAVGYYYAATGGDEPLILHRAGTAWKQVASPAPSGAESTQLFGVSAVSETDAWAAGQYTNNSGVKVPLIMHWNGTAWSQVASPAPSGAQTSVLFGVSADSATDAWAAGRYENSSGATVPLIMQWNGTAWSQVASPAPSGTTYTSLSGVSADSATDAWAAGSYDGSSGLPVPLTLHWNGTAWSQVASPAPSGALLARLFGVGADSATDAWAVGQYTNSSSVVESLILHWNGTAWKKVKSPNGA
jgi:hypothetical protein